MDKLTNPSEYLDEIAGGYRGAQVLITANRLNLFTIIGSRKMTTPEIADAADADCRGIRILCDALCALKILSKEKNRYFNNEVSTCSLLADSPEPKAAIFQHAARLYEKWGGLYDTVKEGKPVSEQALDPRLDKGKKGFARAMQDTASKSARLVAEKIDLSKVSKMLDLGGGPGLYPIECCRQNPILLASILDDPETLKVARANISAAGFTNRINLIPGDMFETPFGDGFDLILISNIVHIYSSQKNQTLVRKCFKALKSGGRLCLKDFFLDSTRTQPAWAAMFAVNMLVNTDEGDCYTFEEVQQWLKNSGYSDCEYVEITPLSTAILATRK